MTSFPLTSYDGDVTVVVTCCFSSCGVVGRCTASNHVEAPSTEWDLTPVRQVPVAAGAAGRMSFVLDAAGLDEVVTRHRSSPAACTGTGSCCDVGGACWQRWAELTARKRADRCAKTRVRTRTPPCESSRPR